MLYLIQLSNSQHGFVLYLPLYYLPRLKIQKWDGGDKMHINLFELKKQVRPFLT